MKKIKSVLALLLAIMLVFGLCGCHKQGEIAVTFGDIEFTSAMYSYALLSADSEARTLVDEQLASAESTDSTSSETSEDVDYYSQKIEDTDYVTWVENRALEILALQAAFRQLCKDNSLELDDETKAELDSYAEYYYSYYGTMFQANGIGESTYREMLMGDAYSDEYFMFLYGEGGSKEVAKDDIKKVYNDSYRTAFIIEESTADLEEEAVDELRTKLEGYKTRLESNESIVALYNEYYELKEDSDSFAKEEKDVMSCFGDPDVDTSRGATYWSEVKDLAYGSVIMLEDTDNSVIRLVKLIDTSADDTYFDMLKDSILWTMKQEEYNNDMETYALTLTPNVNKYAIKPFKVKNIDYGE